MRSIPRTAATTLAALATFALAAAPAPARAQVLPSAKSLMDKHDAAVGGRTALDKHTSIHQAGTLSMAAAGLDATIDIYRLKPTMFLQKLVIGTVGEVLQGFDGKTAWAMQGPQAMVLDSAQAQQFRYNSDFFGNLHDPSRYKSAETVEQVEFDGRQCYKVKLVRLSGAEGFEFFDVATGLGAGMIASNETPMGKVEQTSVFGDYKDFGGVKFPTKILQKGAMGEITITLKTTEFDAVDPSTFALPDAVKALVKPSGATP
ncbi:MAG: hypothetical protein ACHQQ3_14735 [Gemmatimonadales bacterium]